MSVRKVCILGATGSVGMNTLSVIREHPGAFEVFALTAHRRFDQLCDLVRAFRPRYVVLTDVCDFTECRDVLRRLLDPPEVLVGIDGLCTVASHPDVDVVVSAIVGVAGFAPTYAAARHGKTILLANKESLVFGGRWMMEAVQQFNARLLPLDSEHNAIFQCLEGQDKKALESLTLTASGGPFRQMGMNQLRTVTPEQACRHPNWDMGTKISVDSASLMNKGLEVIEASYLFHTPVDKIHVVIHPQSVIHSMVQYHDGSILAQLGSPDMRTPIAYALDYPRRLSVAVERLDFSSISKLTFEQVDEGKFPCLSLAFSCLRHGQNAPLVLNAANEMTVNGFLENQLSFPDIYRLNEQALDYFVKRKQVSDVDSAYALDEEVRLWVRKKIEKVA